MSLIMMGAACIMPDLTFPLRMFVFVSVSWEDVHVCLCITAQRRDKGTGSYIMLHLRVCPSVCFKMVPVTCLSPSLVDWSYTFQHLRWIHITHAALIITAHVPPHGLFVVLLLHNAGFFFLGGGGLIRNGAFAKVLSQCMRVTQSECVGGRVKNECHFECMTAVVCECVSWRPEMLI